MTLKFRLPASVLFLLTAHASSAAVLVTGNQLGGDVVFSISGSLDVSGLTPEAGGIIGTNAIAPASRYLLVGQGATSTRYDDAFSTLVPAFGAGGLASGTYIGDVFGFSAANNLGAPAGYAGGTLAGTLTFSGASYASLGLTPGTYTGVLDTASRDTIIVQINAPAPIPLPGALPALLGALGFGALLARRRRA